MSFNEAALTEAQQDREIPEIVQYSVDSVLYTIFYCPFMLYDSSL